MSFLCKIGLHKWKNRWYDVYEDTMSFTEVIATRCECSVCGEKKTKVIWPHRSFMTSTRGWPMMAGASFKGRYTV